MGWVLFFLFNGEIWWGFATFDAAAMWLFHPIPTTVTLSLCLLLHWQTRLNCRYSFLSQFQFSWSRVSAGLFFLKLPFNILFSASGWTLVPIYWVTQWHCPPCPSLSPASLAKGSMDRCAGVWAQIVQRRQLKDITILKQDCYHLISTKRSLVRLVDH